jgi:hypothetical protein
LVGTAGGRATVRGEGEKLLELVSVLLRLIGPLLRGGEPTSITAVSICLVVTILQSVYGFLLRDLLRGHPLMEANCRCVKDLSEDHNHHTAEKDKEGRPWVLVHVTYLAP